MSDEKPFFHSGIDLVTAGRLIRQTREDHHLSIRELARISGMSANQVIRMETGEDFTMGKLFQLAVHLGIPPARLVDESLKVTFLPPEQGGAIIPRLVAEVQPLLDAVTARMHFAPTAAIIDLVAEVGVMACHLLLSGNPQQTLEEIVFPVPALRRLFEDFVQRYGLETVPAERAAVYRTIVQRPARKLRSLGLLTVEVAEEYVKWRHEEKKSLSQALKTEGDSASHVPVPETSSAWSDLVTRTTKATAKWGAKTQLARDLGVTPQAVNQWLTGANAPSAETTLRLLKWVTEAEATQQQ